MNIILSYSTSRNFAVNYEDYSALETMFGVEVSKLLSYESSKDKERDDQVVRGYRWTELKEEVKTLLALFYDQVLWTVSAFYDKIGLGTLLDHL